MAHSICHITILDPNEFNWDWLIYTSGLKREAEHFTVPTSWLPRTFPLLSWLLYSSSWSYSHLSPSFVLSHISTLRSTRRNSMWSLTASVLSIPILHETRDAFWQWVWANCNVIRNFLTSFLKEVTLSVQTLPYLFPTLPKFIRMWTFLFHTFLNPTNESAEWMNRACDPPGRLQRSACRSGCCSFPLVVHHRPVQARHSWTILRASERFAHCKAECYVPPVTSGRTYWSLARAIFPNDCLANSSFFCSAFSDFFVNRICGFFSRFSLIPFCPIVSFFCADLCFLPRINPRKIIQALHPLNVW